MSETNTEKPREATPEEIKKQNEKFRAERLKRQQARWDWEDRSGATEEAIERWRESKYQD